MRLFSSVEGNYPEGAADWDAQSANGGSLSCQRSLEITVAEEAQPVLGQDTVHVAYTPWCGGIKTWPFAMELYNAQFMY